MKWRTLAGLLCAALAVALGLLAADVSSWRSAFMRDDIRFRALPRHHDLWQPSTILPGDPASALLGTSSSVRWREALQSFAATQTLTGVQSATKGPALRASAQQRLLTQLAAAPTKSQRSQAANLLGVLVVTTPAGSDERVLARLVKRGASYFKQAIALDPGNASYRIDFGRALAGGSHFPDAELQYQKAIAADPSNVEAHYWLGELYRSWQPPRFADAAAQYRKAVSLAPDSVSGRLAEEALQRLLGAQGTPPAGTPAPGATP
jgi:tetratricopeptide (TPR) repeat protein